MFLEPNGKRQYLYVYNTEEVVYDDRTNWRTTNAVTTNTLGTAVQMTELEPKDLMGPEYEIYQLRAGVKGGGFVYIELMAGTHRRGTWKSPVPTSTNYYIGYLNHESSPYDDPRFEMWLKHNQYPAFSVYNPWKLRKIEVELHFVGKKIRAWDMDSADTPAKIGVDPAVIKEMLARVRAGTWPHRAITPRGLEA